GYRSGPARQEGANSRVAGGGDGSLEPGRRRLSVGGYAAGSMLMAETSSSVFRPRAISAGLLCVLLGLEALTPAQSTFRSTSSMYAARVYFSLTPLSNGSVLAAGGYSTDGAATATAELFDLTSERWVLTGPM